MLTVYQFETAEAFARLEQEWNQLLRQSPVDDAFLTWEWLSTWWKHYGHHYQLRLLVAYERDELVGMAPLMLERQRGLGRPLWVLRNIGLPPPDVSGFLVTEGRSQVIRAFAEHLVAERDSWDMIWLQEFPQASFDSEAFLGVFAESGCTVDVLETQHFVARLNGDWDTYQRGLSRNVRKTVRRRQRRLEEQGEVTFFRYVGNEVIPKHIHTIFALHQRSHHPEDYQSPSEQALHLDLAGVMGAQGWVDVSFLLLDGQLIAYQYGFLYGQRANVWRSAFDTVYYAYSPGSLLLFRFIQDCFDRGVTEVDFLRGSHSFKESWQVDTVTFCHPRIVQRALVPQLKFVWWPRVRKSTRLLLSRSAMGQRFLTRYDNSRRERLMTHLS